MKIQEMKNFSKTWRNYLKKVKIDDKEVKETNEKALIMKKETDRQMRRLNSFIFNKKMIDFVKNVNGVDMSNIGVIRFKSVGSIDLSLLEQIDISDIIPNNAKSFKVYCQGDGSFHVLFTDSNCYLNQIVFDKNKKIISQQKQNDTRFQVYYFNKTKDFIVASGVYSYYCLIKFDLNLLLLEQSDNQQFHRFTIVSADDKHIYAFRNSKLKKYNTELSLIKEIGQNSESKIELWY